MFSMFLLVISACPRSCSVWFANRCIQFLIALLSILPHIPPLVSIRGFLWISGWIHVNSCEFIWIYVQMFRIARTSNVNRVAFDPVAFNRMAFDRGEFKFRCAFEIPTELGDINRYIGNFKLNDSMFLHNERACFVLVQKIHSENLFRFRNFKIVRKVQKSPRLGDQGMWIRICQENFKLLVQISQFETLESPKAIKSDGDFKIDGSSFAD